MTRDALWGLGYRRRIAKPDGTLSTVYYFNNRADPAQCNGSARQIAATLGDRDAL